jgi:hypothetical protein
VTGATADVRGRPRGTERGGAFAYLDLGVLILAVPILLLAGAPALGFGLGAGGWLAARALGFAADHAAARFDDPRRALLVAIAALFGRLWLVALAVILAGRLGEDRDGLAAVLVIGAAFTVYLAISIVFRPRPAPRGTAAQEEER